MMRYIQILLILICIGIAPQVSFSQSIFNLSNATNKNLSDNEIKNLVIKMQENGVSSEQIIAIARQKGASESQIQELLKRIEEEQAKKRTKQYIQTPSPKKSTKTLFSQKKNVAATNMLKQIFGFQFFNTENLTFDPNENVEISDEYILSTGDNIQINVYGISQQTYSLEIEKSRAINIQGIGPIYIGGLPFGKAKNIIKSRLSTIYGGMKGQNPNTFVSISVGNISGINVNIIGEANLPGTYTLPATAKVLKALYLAGGPGENGSFREIELIRKGKKIATIDIYKYLVNGDSRENVQLQNNDVILIKPYIQRIFIKGAFKRNGIFEAKPGESVANMIQYAGGFNTFAYNKQVNLTRNNDESLTIKTVEANDYINTPVENGDIIEAIKVSNRFANRVAIKGAVFRPGEYELTPPMTLQQLITKAGGVKEEAFLDKGIVTRRNDKMELQTISFSVKDVIAGKEKVFLQREDEVLISTIFEMREKQTVRISGAVQSPGLYNFTENMTLEDLIFIAGGFLEKASSSNIEIVRRIDNETALSDTDKLTETYTVAVNKDLKLDSPNNQMKLEPFDEIYVRETPGFSKREGIVQIMGEVNYTGEYGIATKRERISDLIERAGGLTEEGYAAGASLRRKVISSEAEITAKKQIFEQDSTMSNETVQKIKYTTVAINLAEILKNKRSKIDLFLEDGDKILIPRKLQTVKVSGAVLNPLSLTYKEHLNVKDYINMSGGFSLQAKKRKVYVIYPNGEAHATTGAIFRNYPKVVPGCEIIVPEKPQIDKTASAQKWIGIGSGLASIAASVAALISISRR